MAKKSYSDIFREFFNGNKYLPSGELNPNYNPKWGLKLGTYFKQAEELKPFYESLLAGSKTEKPREYLVSGMLFGKSQFQYKELEASIKAAGITDARQRAIDLARMDSLINETANMEAVTVGKKVVQPPIYYAELYAEGKISRQEFFDAVKDFEKSSEAYIVGGYGKD